MPAQTSVKSEMNTVQYHPLCPNIVTAVLLLYILWTGFYPPGLSLSMCKEFIVHGTLSCVSKHSYYYCTVDPFPPSRLTPAQTSVKSEMNTVQHHPLYPNVVTAVLLLYILWSGFYPPDLCLSV